MLPTIVLVFSFHLSLHHMSGCGAAADEVVYDRPSGQPLVLSCRSNPAKGNGTGFSWVYDGLPVPFLMSSICSTKYCVLRDSLYDLIIQNVSLADSGMYTCSIAYSYGNLPERIRAVTLTVRDVPGLPTIVPAALDMIEGQAFMLTCQSLGGYPAPNITWYKAGLQLQSNVSLSPSSNGDVNGAISIVPSYADDGTSITCVAQNVLGSKNSTAHLNVSYGPRDVVLTSSPASVVEGGDIMLACSAKGKPLPSMSWSMPNTSGSGVQKNDAGAGTSYLYVSNIQRQGAGRYVCIASNLVNKTFNLSSSSNITVDVRYPPGKPNIYPNSANLSSGDNVTLTCNVPDPGNPAARYNWTKDGQKIIVGSSAVTLMLPLVRLSSAGFYVCTAYNSAGAAASNICNISVSVFDASSTLLPRETVIIIVCVVIGSVLLIGIVITVVCCARCRGHKSSPPASLSHKSDDLSLRPYENLTPDVGLQAMWPQELTDTDRRNFYEHLRSQRNGTCDQDPDNHAYESLQTARPIQR